MFMKNTWGFNSINKLDKMLCTGEDISVVVVKCELADQLKIEL